MPWIAEKSPQITTDGMQELISRTVAECRERICKTPKRVLLLPPDITRMHSGSGRITELLYCAFKGEADVHVIPTLGQHVPHTAEENRQMFGSIPNERIHAHDWRGGVVPVGEIPVEVVQESCGSIVDWPIPITLNRMLMEEKWDLIINVGHIVPARGPRLRQSQQELFHRAGRQGPDLRRAHDGGRVRNREQPRQHGHPRPSVLQLG